MNTNGKMINSNVDEMAHNGTLYRQTTKRYRIISTVYVIAFLVYALTMLLYIWVTPGNNNLLVLLDSLFLKTGVALCGFMSCRKQSNIYAVMALIIQTISLFFCPTLGTFFDYITAYNVSGMNFNGLLLILVIVLAIFTISNNHQYKYLSEQEGFPHFNERRVNQEFEIKQSNIKDKFQQNYERLKKTETDEMSDLSKAVPSDFMSGQFTTPAQEMEEL